MSYAFSHVPLRINNTVGANFLEHFSVQFIAGLGDNMFCAKLFEQQCCQDIGLNIFANSPRNAHSRSCCKERVNKRGKFSSGGRHRHHKQQSAAENQRGEPKH